jgi:hypothetical protein
MTEKGEKRLEEVRGELQRLGYLDRRMERYLLQDAFRPEAPGRTVALLTSKIAFLIGLPVALLLTLVVAAQGGLFETSPFDLLPLFLHLLLPTLLLLGGAFLLLALLLVALLRLTHFRRIDASAFALAALAAAAAVLLLALFGREARSSLPDAAALLLVLALPAVGYGVLRTVHDGLLSLAIRLAEDAPERPLGWRRALVGVFLAAAFVFGLPVFFAVRGEPATDPSSLPMARGEKVLLIGVDGVLPPELLFLLGEGQLPEIGRRLAAGGAILPYERPAVAPSDFWTTVATGVPSPHHGMQSLDAYRPAGLSRPLLRASWLRPYWRLLESLGLAEYRPVLAGERRVFTFWELLARGGLPSLVVNWWGTFPVEPGAGRQLAHGAYQLLEQKGAAAPEGWLPGLDSLRREARLPPGLEAGLRRALGDEAAARLADGALRPDVFYRAALAAGLAEEPALRAAALYLPGLDIAAAGLGGDGEAGQAAGLQSLGSAAFGELLRWQLREVDGLLAGSAGSFETVVILFDPGRRGQPAGGRGLMLLLRPGSCRPPESPAVQPPAIAAAAVLRALGLPQSLELPAPPAACSWPEPPLELPSYGRRRPAAVDVDAEEYLHSLRSLGYV